MSLNPDTKEAIKNARAKDKIRILFVCLGNICRSPAAQGIFQARVDSAGDAARFEIDSAGTGGWHIGDLPDHRMRVHASRRGYDLTHRARQFKATDFDDFDLIVAMDGSNRYDLLAAARTVDDRKKIIMMGDFITRNPRFDHIPDPYYEGSEGFELVLDLLEDASENLYNALTAK